MDWPERGVDVRATIWFNMALVGERAFDVVCRIKIVITNPQYLRLGHLTIIYKQVVPHLSSLCFMNFSSCVRWKRLWGLLNVGLFEFYMYQPGKECNPKPNVVTQDSNSSTREAEAGRASKVGDQPGL